ncbi:hypothetical protein [Bacteroides heparinolyticus]
MENKTMNKQELIHTMSTQEAMGVNGGSLNTCLWQIIQDIVKGTITPMA